MSIWNGWFQCQFTGAWRGGFLHCWPAQAELCLPELQESFSSAILSENPTRTEERGENKKRKFVQIHLAGVQTRWEMLAMGRCCKQAFIHQADMGNVNPAHFRGCCLILWWGFGEQFLGSLWKSNLLGVHVWSTSSLHQAGIPALASMGRDGLLANVPRSMCILHQ